MKGENMSEAEKKMKIEMDDARLVYTGRIDNSNAKEPLFIYPASGVEFNFYGSRLSVEIKNLHSCYHNYIGCVLDNKKPVKTEIIKHGERYELTVCDNIKEGSHHACLYKCEDAAHYYYLYAINIYASEDRDAKLLDAPVLPKRKIEVFGDSVSAGEVSEAVEYVGKPDPLEHEGIYSNAWYSYSAFTARKLNAVLYDEAQGGIALFDKTGYFRGPDYIGMESTYDKLAYNDQIMPITEWDFSRYIPNVVIIAIGQNDHNPDDYMGKDMNKSRHWKEHYKMLICNIRKHYPKALFILATTILMHDSAWDDAIDEVAKSFNDRKVVHFLYSGNGKGTPGHIRIPEADKMSDELSAFIESFGEDVWKD
jgi:hypothetical protein